MPHRIPRLVIGYLRKRQVKLSFVVLALVAFLVLGAFGCALESTHNQGLKLTKQTKVLAFQGKRLRRQDRKIKALVSEVRRSARRNTHALCALHTNVKESLKDDLARLKESKLFLRDNPHGIPGIPAKLLRRSIAARQVTVKNDRATTSALSIVGCPER